jgi:hypothetical protein
MGTGCGWNHPEKIRPRGEIRKKTSKEKIKKKERKRKKEKERKGIIDISLLHSQKKSFCQTFS